MNDAVTMIIRKQPASHDCGGDLRMHPECMYGYRAPNPSRCHHGNPRTQCDECEFVKRMFASIPTRSRALVGNGGAR